MTHSSPFFSQNTHMFLCLLVPLTYFPIEDSLYSLFRRTPLHVNFFNKKLLLLFLSWNDTCSLSWHCTRLFYLPSIVTYLISDMFLRLKISLHCYTLYEYECRFGQNICLFNIYLVTWGKRRWQKPDFFTGLIKQKCSIFPHFFAKVVFECLQQSQQK